MTGTAITRLTLVTLGNSGSHYRQLKIKCVLFVQLTSRISLSSCAEVELNLLVICFGQPLAYFFMIFNELNSVEHFIVHRLSGVNLNSGEVHEPAAGYGSAWEYVASSELGREQNEVLLVEDFEGGAGTLESGNCSAAGVGG